jgi:hypothetical protein
MSKAFDNVIKLRNLVSVRDFGVVGDGVSNDTAAIQLAVTHGLANNVPIYWPTGVYLCGALTAASGGDLIWYGDQNAEIKRTGADITLISPTGNVHVSGLKFTDYMIGFRFNSIAADKQIVFSDCQIQNCGTIATAGGRVDYQGFITNTNASSNKIARLTVTNCRFVGDDFGISWQGKLNEALISDCSFTTFRRIAIVIGLQASGRTAKDCENITITNCTFRDIIANDAAESEIHAMLLYGYRVIVSDNVVDTCYDIHASTHDSEAIYLKTVLASVQNNVVQDGGRGDGMITVKGEAFIEEPDDVTDANRAKYILIANNVLNVSDDFHTTYGTVFSAVYVQGSRIDIANNTISGTYDRAIDSTASGHIHGNVINAICSYGILHNENASTDQTFVKITNNVVEMLGVTAAGISTRLYATTAIVFPLVQIDSNIVRLGSSATLSGEQACIAIKPQRVAVGKQQYASRAQWRHT